MEGRRFLSVADSAACKKAALLSVLCLAALPGWATAGLVLREHFTYVGAFRLPQRGERPLTFQYGGEALAFNPSGDPNGAHDGFPGSLFVMGHNRMPWGELPHGNQVAEVSIPVPMAADITDDLNTAVFLQPFTEADRGLFGFCEEIPRAGMEYLETDATGPLLHICFGSHLEDERLSRPTHAWISPDLSNPGIEGGWRIGTISPYSVNDYLFAIPQGWALEHTGGRVLATGRFRDGGWGGMGPSLHAYKPWIDGNGTPAPAGTSLEEMVLLQYASSRETSRIEMSLKGYQHPDEWTGGAWLETPGGNTAVLFAGTRGTGDYYWYGYLGSGDPAVPCVEREMIGQFDLCRMADGTPVDPPGECLAPASGRGWWSSSFSAGFILYDPDDLAAVAGGRLAPWEPQPYAFIPVDRHLFLNREGIEQDMLGSGEQRRFRLGDAAWDADRGHLYVLELFADGAAPVVHVWRVR